LQCAGETDPEVARVEAAWPELPPHIKAAVLALVEAARSPVPAGSPAAPPRGGTA
jgi:hypothetical protein